MADAQYAVFIEGLSALGSLDSLSDDIIRKARMAVNQTIRRAQTLSARSMEQQINFPRNYLSGDNGRLSISKFATDGDLNATLRGRDRPTSLARFVVGGVRVSRSREKGVSVEVKPGIARRLKGAFAIKLRSGNIGLAIRTKDGKAPSTAYKPKEIFPGVWLLYGPSVDQVFKETREEVRPELEDYLENEFTRLMDAAI